MMIDGLIALTHSYSILILKLARQLAGKELYINMPGCIKR